MVGDHALAALGQPRYTGDIDLRIGASAANLAAPMRVLERLGMGSDGLRQEEFLGDAWSWIDPDLAVTLSQHVTPPSRSWPQGRLVAAAGAPRLHIGCADVSLRRKPKNLLRLRRRAQRAAQPVPVYSTVTLLARFLGLSTSVPRAQAV
jgi:hypothetical protein